jgi:hypothetical protein
LHEKIVFLYQLIYFQEEWDLTADLYIKVLFSLKNLEIWRDFEYSHKPKNIPEGQVQKFQRFFPF